MIALLLMLAVLSALFYLLVDWLQDGAVRKAVASAGQGSGFVTALAVAEATYKAQRAFDISKFLIAVAGIFCLFTAGVSLWLA